jgi:hypothetical protein
LLANDNDDGGTFDIFPLKKAAFGTTVIFTRKLSSKVGAAQAEAEETEISREINHDIT